ncbi:MAG: tetratricopeptide repeat protein [Myxococcales bacterium]|nr:tetratricopeptide repeat protein [Myxococcales bacterium]
MRLLYRLYLRRGDVRSAVRYLDQEIRATRHPREAAALYRERGKLVETHFGDRNAALQCYQAALKATPRDLAVLRSVETIALHQGNIFNLIANLELQLEVLHDPPAVAGILRDLALLESRRGGDLRLASDMLGTALEEVNGHLSVAQDLYRVAALASDVEMELRALEAEADALAPDRRGHPLAEISRLLRANRERSAALQLLEAAALSQPHVYSLWRMLEDQAMAAAAYEVAVEACVGQLKALGDGDPLLQAELFYRIGKLAMIRLDRVGEGLAAMRKALRLDPLHIPALEDAGRYLIANESWAQLLEFLREQAANAEATGASAEERSQSLVRAGQILEESLQELDGARQLYEDALTACPTFRPASDRLERVLHQLGRHTALREHYHAELGRTSDPPRKVFLLSLLSQLAARDPDPQTAIKYLVTLLKEVPEHLTSIQLLARLLARAQRPRDLLQVTEQEVKLTLSAARRAKLLQRAAELALELGERERAFEFLHGALAAIDDHQPSIELLDRLLREDGDDVQLLDLLRRRLEHTVDRERRVALHLEIANLQATRLGDKEAALAEIDTLLDAWPGHLPGLHRGERLAVDQRRWGLLVKFLEQHVAAAKSSRTQALLLYRVALIRSRELGEDEAAITDLRRALALWPELGVARALLLDLCLQRGEIALLRDVALDGLARERSPGERRAIALLLAENTPEPELALAYLRAACAGDPGDVSARLRLARASRASGDLRGAAEAFEGAAATLTKLVPAGDAQLRAIQFQAAHAREEAGDTLRAARAYAELVKQVSDPLARRGRDRLAAIGSTTWERSLDALTTAAEASEAPLERAAFLGRAAELELRRGNHKAARAHLERAVKEAPSYLPALFMLAQACDQEDDPRAAIDALERLAHELHDAGPRADILCQAGRLALTRPQIDEPGPLAWKLFGEALKAAPASELAFRGLWLTLQRHGSKGAPVLGPTLDKRLEIHARTGGLTVSEVRALGRIGMAVDGPRRAASLLEKAIAVAGFEASVYVDLAQAYAHLDRWGDALQQLQSALRLEPSAEKRAALHFFAGEAQERAGNRDSAIHHYIEASRGGYYPRHALTTADRLASEIGSIGQRIEVLRLLVDRGELDEKLRGLRELAELHAGELGEAEASIGYLRELLRLEPTDIAAITRLAEVLRDFDRHDEAYATLVSGIAAHRRAIALRGLRNRDGDSDPAAIIGLHQLFDATEEQNGVYTCASILEIVDPRSLPADRDADSLHPGEWPLPVPRDDLFPALCSGKDATIAAMMLIREGISYLTEIPGVPPPPDIIQNRRSLPTVSSVAQVTSALAQALGITEPDIYLNPDEHRRVHAWASGSPSIVIGKNLSHSPGTAESRDKLGRALLRLALGGDHVVQRMPNPQLLGLLAGLSESVGITLELRHPVDSAVAEAVIEILSTGAASLEFGEHAERLSRCVETFDPTQLRAAFVIAEDRAAVLCAGDPRISIRELRRTGALTSARGQALLTYLISDDHLSLRRSLGYSIEVELDIDDVEEIP